MPPTNADAGVFSSVESRESFPDKYIYFELDGDPLSAEQKESIWDTLGDLPGKFIVYGESSPGVAETQNKSFIFFFPDDDEYSHLTSWRGIKKTNAGYEVKDAGIVNMNPHIQSLYGTSPTLRSQMDEEKQMKWRVYLKETFGIQVSENLYNRGV